MNKHLPAIQEPFSDGRLFCRFLAILDAFSLSFGAKHD